MKKLLALLFFIPIWATAATNVSVKMEIEGKKYSEKFLVTDGKFSWEPDEGVAVIAEVRDTQYRGHECIAFDIRILKDGEMVTTPYLRVFPGKKGRVKMGKTENGTEITTFKFSVVGTHTDDSEHEEA